METNKIADAPTLVNKFNENDYPKYDNYDAINVNKLAEIPYDYEGVMGVPITIIDKVCSDGLIHFDTPMLEETDSKYKIIGQGQGNLYRELPNCKYGLSQKFVNDYYKSGQKGSIKENHPVLGYYANNGKPIIPYMRILIQKIK